jgi:hypothetical protein
MFKVQAIFHDGQASLEFMTDDASETEEMRIQLLAIDCVPEVVVRDDPHWIVL